LVHERVVRVQKRQRAAVFEHDAFIEHLRFALHGFPQVVSKSGKTSSIGYFARRFLRYNHWPAKFAPRARARSSASMRLTCASRTAGSFSRPLIARSSNWSSGTLLQMKNERRDASSRSLTR